MYLDELVAAILAKPGPLRLVAVDGPGGAGKSTFARELSGAAGGAPVVHTDDFAAADNPIDWWPRLLEQVIEPFALGDAAHYQRYDWPSETLTDWHTIEPAPIVIIEGVSAGRSEWAAHLSFLIWIETRKCGASTPARLTFMCDAALVGQRIASAPDRGRGVRLSAQ